MLKVKTLGIFLGIVLLGMSAAAIPTLAQSAVGSGVITTVSSDSKFVLLIPPGATINLNAPGTLNILYDGHTILTGTAETPITTINTASFTGKLSPLNNPYNGLATKIDGQNWQLTLSFPKCTEKVTLSITGTLTIT